MINILLVEAGSRHVYFEMSVVQAEKGKEKSSKSYVVRSDSFISSMRIFCPRLNRQKNSGGFKVFFPHRVLERKLSNLPDPKMKSRKL